MSNSNTPNLNQAVIKAVHALANQKLKTVANTIKQATNANGARKNELIKSLQIQLEEAKQAATAATAVAPGVPVAPAALSAENAAAAAVAKNLVNFNARIQAANDAQKLNNVKSNIVTYTGIHRINTNRNNIKKRLNTINKKRTTLFPPQEPGTTNNPFNFNF